jgi:hypothetical protein
VRAHRHQDPEPIRRRNPAVPEGLAGVVHRLMAKDASLRPPSAAAARQELLAFSDPPALLELGNNPNSAFELVEDADEAPVPDTLSEVFRFDERPDDSPTISPDSVRTLFEERSSPANLGLVLVLLAIGMSALILISLMAKMR